MQRIDVERGQRYGVVVLCVNILIKNKWTMMYVWFYLSFKINERGIKVTELVGACGVGDQSLLWVVSWKS